MQKLKIIIAELWHALESYGILESMLRMIRSLHDGMKAEVTVDGQVVLEFEVCNGLRQGCVLAPPNAFQPLLI